MQLRLRVWLPLIAVFIVVLTIATILLFGLPTARSRLAEYSETRALTRAAAAADAVGRAEASELEGDLDPVARAAGGELFVVNASGRVAARGGPRLLSSLPEGLLQAASAGDRTVEDLGERRAATVPLIRGGSLEGGVVFVPDDEEITVFRIFSRSNLEGGIVAIVLGGGLMLLVATLLSRRVERLTLGARSLERGNLSARIEPGYGDELGELAESFNAMAGRLEGTFAQLQERQATLDAILSGLTEGVLAADLDGRIVFANPAARAMLGVGGPESLAELPEPWEEFSLSEAVARCARGKEREEARVRGPETFFRVTLEHLPGFDDHRGGVLVVIQDLSEGRRLEANQQRFLANAAHELRTPITSILGSADLLLTEERDDPEVRRRFLERIAAEAERMQRLSDTLLRLARTGTDLRDSGLEPLDLGDAASEAVERMQPLAKGAGVRLTIEGRGAVVRADAEWLEQALLALVGNAMKHSGRGGRVLLRLEGAAVSVEDEGEGISEENLPFVFERFYRGGDEPGGFGLGLPICKELVERMGGEISISSEEGAGATVRVELREVDANDEDTGGRGRSGGARGRRARRLARGDGSGDGPRRRGGA